MAWNLTVSGTGPQVSANLNGINSGANMTQPLEVRSIGYARTLINNILADLQNPTLAIANNGEFVLTAQGSAGTRHIHIHIQLDAVALDSVNNIQTKDRI